jgi:hypothetical protein
MLNIPHEKRYYGLVLPRTLHFSFPSPRILISPIVVLVIPCDHHISRRERGLTRMTTATDVPIGDTVQKVSAGAIFCRPKHVPEQD